jgi:hypothetical protein
VAFERQLDFGFDVRCLSAGFDGDRVRYAAHAGKFANIVLRRCFLISAN